MKRTVIINLFGGPGSGKSTVASGLFYTFKSKGITCDNPYEFPKQVAWEDNTSQITDQLYILANQHRGIVRSYGKVNYIILDSPLLLSLVYKTGYTGEYPAKHYNDTFDKMVLELFNSYENINIFLDRADRQFQQEGRFQSQTESLEYDEKIKKVLEDNDIPYHNVKVGDNELRQIIEVIRSYIKDEEKGNTRGI
jgi:predicted DNA-binding ArsR family transcriptional regulator